MTVKSKARKVRSTKPTRSSDIEERIRRRAYELYEQRGRRDRFALDLLQVEAEVLGAPRQPNVRVTRASQR